MLKNVIIAGIGTTLVIGCAMLGSSAELGQEASQALNANRPESALQLINRAIHQDSQNGALYVKRAIIYQYLQKHSAAANDYLTALKYAPDNSYVLANYGVFACKQKNYTQAHNLFAKALTAPDLLNPDQVYIFQGDCFSSQNDIDNASNSYLQALKNESAPLAAYAGISNVYLLQNNYAIAYYYIDLYHGAPDAGSIYLKIITLRGLVQSSTSYSDHLKLQNQLSALEAQLQSYYPNTREANLAKQQPQVTQSDDVVITSYNPNELDLDTPNNDNIWSRIRINNAGRSYIIILKSDTLFSIAKQSKSNVADLIRINKLKANQLKSGSHFYLN